MRGNFSPCKAEEESRLSPADDENAAGRKINRKDVYSLVGEQYNMKPEADITAAGRKKA